MEYKQSMHRVLEGLYFGFESRRSNRNNPTFYLSIIDTSHNCLVFT